MEPSANISFFQTLTKVPVCDLIHFQFIKEPKSAKDWLNNFSLNNRKSIRDCWGINLTKTLDG